jgi:hypothetical protein
MEVSNKFRALPSLPRQAALDTHQVRCWMGHSAVPEMFAKR